MLLSFLLVIILKYSKIVGNGVFCSNCMRPADEIIEVGSRGQRKKGPPYLSVVRHFERIEN